MTSLAIGQGLISPCQGQPNRAYFPLAHPQSPTRADLEPLPFSHHRLPLSLCRRWGLASLDLNRLCSPYLLTGPDAQTFLTLSRVRCHEIPGTECICNTQSSLLGLSLFRLQAQ